MGKRLIQAITVAVCVVLLTMPSYAESFDERVSKHLTGGDLAVKSMSIWQLNKYKYTTLLEKSPMRWCPFEAYLTVDEYVHIKDKNNRYYFCISTDLTYRLHDVAKTNKRLAKAFKATGDKRHRVKQIYKFCKRTTYVPHAKTVQGVIESRTGDCTGIASTFYVLCQANHIPVRFVIGWEPNGCHAWNQAKVNGEWYWVDATHGKWLSKKQYKGRSVMEKW